MRQQPVVVTTGAGITGAFLAAAGIFVQTDQWVRYLFIVLGIVLLLIALWALRVGLRPHPAMKRYYIVKLDSIAIKEAARAEIPIELPLGSSNVSILIRPNPVTLETAEIIVANQGKEPERRPLPEDEVTFAGEVPGEKESEVRLTIGEGWMRGYVLTSRDWWFIEPLRKFRLEATHADYVVYRTKDLRFKLELGDDYKPRKVQEQRRDEGLDPPHRVNPIVPICMVHDEQYSWQAGGRPYDYQRALINEVNGIYRRLGCEFRISVFVWTYNWLTSTNADRMLDQVEDAVRNLWTDLRPAANRRARNTEVAHATTGKNLDGNTLGIAWQPGVYGLSQQQLVWVGGGGLFGGPPNLAFQNMMVAAHEIGHNFNGAHEEADEWCVSHFIWCWDYVRTILWATIYDDSVPRFSAGDRDPRHNNAQRISNNMSSGRNINF